MKGIDHIFLTFQSCSKIACAIVLESINILDETNPLWLIKPDNAGKKQRVQITGIVMDKTLVVHYLSPDADFRPATAELPLSEFAKGSQGMRQGFVSISVFHDA